MILNLGGAAQLVREQPVQRAALTHGHALARMVVVVAHRAAGLLVVAAGVERGRVGQGGRHQPAIPIVAQEVFDRPTLLMSLLHRYCDRIAEANWSSMLLKILARPSKVRWGRTTCVEKRTTYS